LTIVIEVIASPGVSRGLYGTRATRCFGACGFRREGCAGKPNLPGRLEGPRIDGGPDRSL